MVTESAAKIKRASPNPKSKSKCRKKKSSKMQKKSKQHRRSQPDETVYYVCPMGKFRVHKIEGDGNCLFRTMAFYVLGKQAEHAFVRDRVTRYIWNNWEDFKNFMTDGDRDAYVNRMSFRGTFGSEAEIVAFTNVFACKVYVFSNDRPGREPLTYGTSDTICFLLYSGVTDCGHYDALQPASFTAFDVKAHRESIRLLREKTQREFEEELRYFKNQRS